jgi:glutamyl-tRNA synthetase
MHRYRFAPSPTGHLHIGGARTALYNYLMAHKTGGKFILRIEDTDRERSTQEYIDSILEAMKWLGLDYDEGPFYQTQRTELYREHIEKLLKEGKAYRCFCTTELLQSKREAAMKAGLKPKYDGTCRKLDPKQSAQDSRPACIRFVSSDEGFTEFNDLIKGPIRFDNKELDDLVIARTDGTPTYNFVVVIDDLTMGITHVIRGDDHINNTPRQIQLYRAFAYPIPTFAHVPMILGADKKRLSKRHGATSVLAYRDEGFLPEALLNYLVRLGWASGDQEVFPLEELKKTFDIKDVGASAAVFNPEKLLWLNGHWIRQAGPERLLEATRPFLEKLGITLTDEAYAKRALMSGQEKVKTLIELADLATFYFREEITVDEKTRQKCFKGNYQEILKKALNTLTDLQSFDQTHIEKALASLSEREGLKLGEIAQPLRAALTGSMVSPGIYDVIAILGKERVENRIKHVIEIESRI